MTNILDNPHALQRLKKIIDKSTVLYISKQKTGNKYIVKCLHIKEISDLADYRDLEYNYKNVTERKEEDNSIE